MFEVIIALLGAKRAPRRKKVTNWQPRGKEEDKGAGKAHVLAQIHHIINDTSANISLHIAPQSKKYFLYLQKIKTHSSQYAT
ncbi:MAG: hypothetical protein HUK09_04325 [Bacteroidaceae bacterium]|nr:hypothetical protein [Bacteroidaceae bacterium]